MTGPFLLEAPARRPMGQPYAACSGPPRCRRPGRSGRPQADAIAHANGPRWLCEPSRLSDDGPSSWSNAVSIS
eukprot:CAMPEP_0170646548 /NCGR_PEP_ID=MMETSP0224-20130122/43699_1 /TAXON_ID=285029 /ORGANISM="Togula jolla, Strain CCCM 725" /LENGTH=72 /DNA_ID=CAMNT_0010977893 /DNA_START=310 /DNA_END=528 /DNA_ORIENTATION=+